VFADAFPGPEQLEQHYGGYPRLPVTSKITFGRYEELLDGFEPERQLGRLLDVGCGVGDFLLRAKSRGWKVDGVELEARARAICAERGLDVQPAPLAPEQYEPGSFDVVTALEVLEHMVNPRRELELIAGLLRPGGVLYVTTPNFSSLTRRLLGPRYEVICFPEHLGYFRTSTLDRLLTEGGLSRVTLRATGISPGQVYAAMRPQTPGARRSVDESVREVFEGGTLRQFKQLVNRSLTQLSLGDTLKATYRRV
jgi:SAM-dependent methyltransferase